MMYLKNSKVSVSVDFCQQSFSNISPITTTSLAGGLFCPYKGLLPTGISRCMKRLAFRSTTFSCTSFPTNPKGLLLFSCERIYIFLHTYLIAHYIFLQLCTYVFFYLFCILPHCINIIASTPKVTIPIFIF